MSEPGIGMKLKVLRESASVTQTELARRMAERGWPWHQSTVYRVESGRQAIRVEEAAELENLLNATAGQLSREDAAGADVPERAFGALLRQAREEYGMSQDKFAAEMARQCDPAWCQQTVTRVENGQRAIRLGEAIAAASILGIDLGAFAAGNPAPRRICANCRDEPWPGFTCNECGRSGPPGTCQGLPQPVNALPDQDERAPAITSPEDLALPSPSYARAMLAVRVRDGAPPDEVAKLRRAYRAARAAKGLRELVTGDHPPTAEQRRELAAILVGGDAT